MVATLQRFAPPIALLAAFLLGYVLLSIGDHAERGFVKLHHYSPAFTAGLFVLIVACSVAAGWWARRGARSTCGRYLAAGFAALGLALSGALLFDLIWATVGPGVDPVVDSCIGGMDCIGEPMPSAPLTGDSRNFLWAVSIMFVIAPAGLVMLILLTVQAFRRPSAPVG